MGSRALRLTVFLAVILTGGAVTVSAQDYAGVTKKAVNGITGVASSIISDSFVPMTHYREGEWTGTFVPSYFKVTRASDDPEFKGDGLDGFSFGFGGGYALTDRFVAYAIFSYMGIDGTLKPTSGWYDGEGVKTEYSLINFNLGLGFDFIKGSKWSAPVFVGFGVHSFDLKLAYPEIAHPVLPGNVTASARGEEIFGSFNLGIAASRIIFDSIKVTPYYLLMVGLNRPTIRADITGAVDLTNKVKMDSIAASMLGLSISFMPTSSISVSMSIGGLLTSSTQFYNRIFLDGMEMFSLVMAVTYRGGFAELKTRDTVDSRRGRYY